MSPERAPSPFRIERLSHCRICGGDELNDYLDLGPQPPSNSFIPPEDIATEQAFPLLLSMCPDCGLSQLRDVVSASDLFDDYLYLSSNSGALCRHYQGLVDDALASLGPAPGGLMVDIGCNDGIMLKAYPTDRYRLLGIDPSSAGAYAREAGFDVVDGFFDEALAARLVDEHGPAALITATNVFAHVDDIRSFAAGVAGLLAVDGTYIIEFPYLIDMIEGGYFDTIYHEHLSYLSLTPLVNLFDRVGLRAFRVERHDVGASGPALRLFVCREDGPLETETSIPHMVAAEAEWGVTDPVRYAAFARHVEELREALLAMIADLGGQGYRVGAYGAPAKGNTLLNYLGLGPDLIICAAENNELKVGKVTPGAHIPIVDDARFMELGITHALLLAWNYLDFFLEKSEFIQHGGKFITPFPEPSIRP